MRMISTIILVLLSFAVPTEAGGILAFVQTHLSPGTVVAGSAPWSWAWGQEKTLTFLNMKAGTSVAEVNLITGRFTVFADSVSVAHLPGGNNFIVAAQHFFFKRPKNARPTTIYEVHVSPNRPKLGVKVIRTVHFPWNFADDTKGHVCKGIQVGPDGIVWEMRDEFGRTRKGFIDLAAVDWRTQKVLGRCRLAFKELGMAGMPTPLNHAVIIFAYPNFKQTLKNGIPLNHLGKLSTILVTADGKKYAVRLAPKLPDKPFRCAVTGNHVTGITADAKDFVSFATGGHGRLVGRFFRKLPLRSIYPGYTPTPKSLWAPRVYTVGYAVVNPGESAALLDYGDRKNRLVLLNTANGQITHVTLVKRSIQWLRVWNKHLYLVSYRGEITPVNHDGKLGDAFGSRTYIQDLTSLR